MSREIDAMKKIEEELADLDAAAISRVVNWIANRFEVPGLEQQGVAVEEPRSTF